MTDDFAMAHGRSKCFFTADLRRNGPESRLPELYSVEL